MKRPFKKVLIANRGEIALRIIRGCHEMGMKAVAVYSEADRESLHVYRADEAYNIGPAPAEQSYLDTETIIETAKKAGCDAIHPGYGFLAESADFAQRCLDEGIVFIGPGPEAMRAMGDKTLARKKVSKAGVPTIPGINRGLNSVESMKNCAREIGYPVLIKAALGGGGKGMRVCNNEDDLNASYELCKKEAQSSFGSTKLYLEKYIDKPRHIEFQILADDYGNTIHLGERECSIQRRHQKLIEESPSTAIDERLRSEMGEAAVAAAKSVGYTNAGTIEFLLDGDKNFYFLEMNTRLQVEHPVTEMITGIDLVGEQFRIAKGMKMMLDQKKIRINGHSIECRIYAEDPESDFMPSCGKIEVLREPTGPWVRVDSGVYQGYEVAVYYDPIIAKLIVWAEDRMTAINRMHRALSEYIITGIKTTIDFHRSVMKDERFRRGDINTHFIDETERRDRKYTSTEKKAAAIVAALFYHENNQERVDDKALNRISPWKLAGRRESLD